MEGWFKIKTISAVMTSLNVDDDDDEDVVLKQVRFRANNLEQYKEDFSYYDITIDPVKSLEPVKFLPKESKYQKTLTRISFASGEFVYAVGDANDIYEKLSNFTATLPQE